MLREHANPLLASKIKRRGPTTLDALRRSGAIKGWHIEAADEIENTFLAITRRSQPKTMRAVSSAEDGPYYDAWPPSGSSDFGESNKSLLMRQRLIGWWDELRDRQVLDVGSVVYSVILDGASLRDLEKSGKCSRKPKGMLIYGLTIYAKMVGSCP